MEATGHEPKQKARLISPTLPISTLGSRRCLTFKANAHGAHLGEFIIRDESGEVLYDENTGALHCSDISLLVMSVFQCFSLCLRRRLVALRLRGDVHQHE